MAKSGIDISFQPALRQVTGRISSLPKEYQREVLTGISDYGLEVLRTYPPEKYVTRKAAYGVSFFTEKQRRWFFAVGIHRTPYRRTGRIGRSWRVIRSDDNIRFTNNSPGIQYVMGDQQSRHEAKVGWKKASKIMAGELTFRSSKFRKAVAEAYQRAIRKLRFEP